MKKYDLEDRTLKFAQNVIQLSKSIQKNPINSNIIQQILKSSTSIGANYMEANGASSKKDFRNKIFICKKEAQETKYWLKLIKTTNPSLSEQVNSLWKESQELTLIFQKIITTLKENSNKK